MSRPKTKEELLKMSAERFNKLNDHIDSLSHKERTMEFPPGTMNRNIRDVLAHLHHWHLLFIDWYKVGMSGQKPDMPLKGYSWKETPALNKWIHSIYQKDSLEVIRKKLKESFSAVQKIIDKHSNEELFEKGRYKWTGSTSLGSYLTSATSSHYDWAYKLIMKCRR